MLKECCETCKAAKPDSPCNCRCGGRYHGINRITEEYPDNIYRTINENLGGEIAEVINKLQDETFTCWCGHKFTVNHFMGYQHEGGLADAQGSKWWVFVICPHCRYEWSWHKLINRLEKQKMLKQSNLEIGWRRSK